MTIALERPTTTAYIERPVPAAAAPKRAARPGRALRVITWITLGLSSAVWLVLMLATPAPVVMFDAAKQGARLVHDRLPPQVRDRIPEELKARIASN